MDDIFPILLGFFFILIGIAIIGIGWIKTAKAKQSSSWPSTKGEITRSVVLRQTDTSNTTNNFTTYKADVAYRYKVQGRSYSSSKVFFSDVTTTAEQAVSVVSRYPANSAADVYYNPNDPAEAVLEPGNTSGIAFLYLLGSLVSVCGLIPLIAGLTGHVHAQ